ncbi:MAG: nitroreductase family protein [Methanobacteriaceae archaeon]|jgi:nitroreductase|nr:nitroreductase family protein [Methanobacteriaceae archaeon]
MNPVLENIKNRRSTRKYLPEQIKKEELDIILEAGIYAPSGHNDQAWHFTVVQNKELIDSMSEESKKAMAELPIDWIAKMGRSENLHIFYNAPTVVVVSGKKDATSPFADCCAAIQNMLLAAESIDIGSCWIGLARFFYENPENLKKLNIPEGYEPHYSVCFGYKAISTSNAPERNRDVLNYIK